MVSEVSHSVFCAFNFVTGGREGTLSLRVGDVLHSMLTKPVCRFSLSCELFIEVGPFSTPHNVFLVSFNIRDGLSFLMTWDGDHAGTGKAVAAPMSACFLLSQVFSHFNIPHSISGQTNWPNIGYK